MQSVRSKAVLSVPFKLHRLYTIALSHTHPLTNPLHTSHPHTSTPHLQHYLSTVDSERHHGATDQSQGEECPSYICQIQLATRSHQDTTNKEVPSLFTPRLVHTHSRSMRMLVMMTEIAPPAASRAMGSRRWRRSRPRAGEKLHRLGKSGKQSSNKA